MRRNFKSIFVLFLGLTSGLFSFPAAMAQGLPAYPRGDGRIRLYNYHLNEFGEFQFRKDGKFLEEILQQMNHLLRSRDGTGEIAINPQLWELIDSLQDHFQADTIEIISGYRSKEFNTSLLKSGHTVSPVSLHIQGKALDIHIDEVKEETLRDYLLSLKLGGVGYYGPLDFIHVDLGQVKSWSESGTAPRKLVGVLDPTAPVQLTSDKNDYLPGDILDFTWDLKEGVELSQVQDIKLEHFWRGQWQACEVIPQTKKTFGLPASTLLCKAGDAQPTYGKYRWTFKLAGKEARLSSNEFYLKKN